MEKLINKTYRDPIIDTARGIAIILMVIGHLGTRSAIVQFIYSFHMPLFFVISGMTAGKGNKQSLSVYLGKRVKRLLVPYILFVLIYAVPGIREYIFAAMGCRQGIEEASSLTPLWFLPCIFVADFIFEVILRYLILPNNNKSAILLGGGVSIICSLIGIIITSFFTYAEWIPFSINISLIVIPFIFLGYCLSISKVYVSMKKKPMKIELLIAALLMLVPLVLYRFNLPVSVTEGFNHVELSIGSCGNYMLFLINAIFGSCSVIFLSIAVDCYYLRKMGQSTLACLGTHGIIISTVAIAVAHICDISWVIYIISLGAVLALTIPVQFVLERYIPNLVGK